MLLLVYLASGREWLRSSVLWIVLIKIQRHVSSLIITIINIACRHDNNNNNNGSFLCSAILRRKWTHRLGRVVSFEACCHGLQDLVCVRDHFYACVHTRELGTPTVSQHIFDSDFSCAPDRVRTSGHRIHWILRPTLYQLSHPVTPIQLLMLECRHNNNKATLEQRFFYSFGA